MVKSESTPLEFPEIAVYDMLRESTKTFSDHVALSFMGKKFTFRELDILTDHFATALAELGVIKGDRVAIFMFNVPQFVIAYYSILKAGATVVLFNPLYKEHELEFQLKDSGANTIILLNLPNPPLYSIFNNIRAKTSIKNVVVTDFASALPTAKRILGSLLGKIPKGPAREPGDHDFFELIKKAQSRPPPIEINPKEDVAAIQYTGGTTGIPKGAVLTHYNLVSNCIQLKQIAKDTSRLLGAIPFYHSYGMTTVMNLGILMGSEIILVTNPRDIPALLKTIATQKPTMFNSVPAMYYAVANHSSADKHDLSSIKWCLSGGAPLQDVVCEAFEAATGATLVEGYGLSEASPVTHVNPLNRETRKIGTIGFPLPGTECCLVDVETGEKEIPKENRENYS